MKTDPKRAFTQAPALMGQGTARDLMMEAVIRLPLWQQILEAMTFEWKPPPELNWRFLFRLTFDSQAATGLSITPRPPEKVADSALQGQGVVGRNAIDTQLSALLAVIQLHYQPIGGQLAPQLALHP